MSKGQVLVLGSNATQLGLRGGSTATVGQYLNETAVPALALLDAGYDIVIATPNGTKPHIDAGSDTKDHFGGDEAAYQRAKDFFASHPAMNDVRTLKSVVDEGLDGFVGVFVPGGHAPIVDLMQDRDAGTILRHFHTAAKPTALLCHGPVAVISALDDAPAFRKALEEGDDAGAADLARDWIYSGYRMTVFSASEEKIAEEQVLKGELYFDMEKALRSAGGDVSVTDENFASNVVVDRELITGQNPASDRAMADALIEALDRAAA
ncbi:type 1 glutamine amidotransferase domain-containing protein (plasmid) [Sphingomonas naphthae]|uniref:Type 1 glutamine amidotransferase domain-containing protein n=1 Tax=Sphingomonas naphthae TaxID=1813468 RepID=A0ABY7TRR5_9SPHN|nr:type 1 glutamine amidotransferase domain-containing protein [Sphingomonas naphthae]WCT75696.1 type 1 glutamine amidotransferase domain-containing protein [Sphingomonas naphthae]